MTEALPTALQAPGTANLIAHQHAADALSAVLQHPVLLQRFCNPACPPQWLAETAQLLSAVLLAAEQSHETAAGATAVWAVTAHRLSRPYLIKWASNPMIRSVEPLLGQDLSCHFEVAVQHLVFVSGGPVLTDI